MPIMFLRQGNRGSLTPQCNIFLCSYYCDEWDYSSVAPSWSLLLLRRQNMDDPLGGSTRAQEPREQTESLKKTSPLGNGKGAAERASGACYDERGGQGNLSYGLQPLRSSRRRNERQSPKTPYKQASKTAQTTSQRVCCLSPPFTVLKPLFP
jgi:hypothetical protein